jgi:hypothetical protein
VGLAGVCLAEGAGCGPRASSAGACARGLLLLDGACVGAGEADSYCGARSSAAGGAVACPAPTCAAGEAIDPVALTCVAERTVRSIVAQGHGLAEDATVGCSGDLVLAAHAGHAGCVAAQDVCPWASRLGVTRGCAPAASCPAGEVRARGGGCLRVRRGALVDVGAWAHAVAEERLCRRIRRAAWDFEDVAGATGRVDMALELVFPNNDVASAAASAKIDAPDSSQAAQADVLAAVDALLVPLRALGGTADAASVSLAVSCPLPTTTAPRVWPRGGPGGVTEP